MLDTILTPRVLATLGIIGLALFAFSFAWAFFKVSFQKALGRPVPRFWLTNALDVAAEVGANLPGAINRALKLAGKPGLFLPTAPTDGSPATAAAALASENAQLRDALAAYQRRAAASRAVTLEIGGNVDPARAAEAVRETLPPVDRDSQRGSVDLGGLVGCLVVALLAVMLADALALHVRRCALCERGDQGAEVKSHGLTPRRDLEQ